MFATILDPNYKMMFFDSEMREMYKTWLIDELSLNAESYGLNFTQREAYNSQSITCASPVGDLLEEYIRDNSLRELEPMC